MSFRNFNFEVFEFLNSLEPRCAIGLLGDRIPRSTWIPFPWLFAHFMTCVDFHGLKNKIAVVALGDCLTLKEEVCGKV